MVSGARTRSTREVPSFQVREVPRMFLASGLLSIRDYWLILTAEGSKCVVSCFQAVNATKRREARWSTLLSLAARPDWAASGSHKRNI